LERTEGQGERPALGKAKTGPYRKGTFCFPPVPGKGRAPSPAGKGKKKCNKTILNGSSKGRPQEGNIDQGDPLSMKLGNEKKKKREKRLNAQRRKAWSRRGDPGGKRGYHAGNDSETNTAIAERGKKSLKKIKKGTAGSLLQGKFGTTRAYKGNVSGQGKSFS